jgi:hypothetical protein
VGISKRRIDMRAKMKVDFLESREFSSQRAAISAGAAYSEAFGLDWNRLLSEIQQEFTPAHELAAVQRPEKPSLKHSK